MPAGWVRNVDRLGPSGYTIVYTEPVPGTDPVAAVEAIGRRISMLVTFDPTGQGTALADSYPGHAVSVNGMPARFVETAPPPGGRHGVAWRGKGLIFEVYAFKDEPELVALAATLTATGRPAQR